MAQRIITKDGWLIIPGGSALPRLTATDILGRALNATMEYNQGGQKQMDIATGLQEPETLLDLINAVTDLREIQYRLRIEAQAINIHAPLSVVYEEGQYNINPRDPQIDKLERMVKGLRQSAADIVDYIEDELRVKAA